MAAAATSLLLTACGSTVPLTGPAALPQGDGLAAPEATPADAGAAGAVDVPGTVVGPVVEQVAGTSGPGAPAGRAGTAGPGAPVPATSLPSTGSGSAVGVTATEIRIGVPYAVNGATAAAAFGASGAGVGGGDGRAQWKVVIDDLNARGGILGRKVVPVYYEQDSTDQSPLDQQEQTECAHFTNDEKVFAVLAPEASPGEVLQACLAKAGVAQVWEDLTRADATTFARYPLYLEAGTLRMDRVAALWPAELQRLGYFSPWDTVNGRPGGAPVKVGIISFDDPTTVRSVEKALRPALRAVGHPDTTWVKIHYPTSTADNGSSISAIQAATLTMASNGITHVLPFDSQGAGVGGFFAVGADSQQYYPRYGVNTGAGAQTLHDAGLWPTSQLHGAVGFGWVPLVDLPFAENPDNGPYSNEARRSCVRLMAAKGQPMTSAIVQRQAIGKCDELRFLAQALTLAGQATSAGLVRGVDALGSAYSSGQTFATRFDSTHHDGAAAVRSLAFVEECSCFRYSGATRTVS